MRSEGKDCTVSGWRAWSLLLKGREAPPRQKPEGTPQPHPEARLADALWVLMPFCHLNSRQEHQNPKGINKPRFKHRVVQHGCPSLIFVHPIVNNPTLRKGASRPRTG